jgi:hypothetical protein
MAQTRNSFWVANREYLMLDSSIVPYIRYDGNMVITNRKQIDGNQGGPTLKDPLQVSDGPITRLRAKKIRKAIKD